MKRTRSGSASSSNVDAASDRIHVAYLGQLYSFTYLAAHRYFSKMKLQVVFEAEKDFKSALDKAVEGSRHYAVLPLESSYNGTILGVYDKLLSSQGKLSIVAEIGELEEHCLCIPKGTDTSPWSISKVYCHPHILECCSEYLDSLDQQRGTKSLPPISRVPTWDSADACSQVVKNGVDSSAPLAAAICSKDAAVFHKLHIVARGIGNEKTVQTRYVVVAARAPQSSPQNPNQLRDPLHLAPSRSLQQISSTRGAPLKASIAVAVKNIPGAIFKVTSCFGLRDVNITKSKADRQV